MKRTIQALAMLIAITLLAVWMVGCGEDDTGTVAVVTGVVPASGEEVAENAEITITFDNPVTDVTVNGQPATGSGKTWKYQGTLQASNAIAWTNEDGSAGEGSSVSYSILEPDTEAPTLSSSTPEDGAEDEDPEPLNTDGMEFKFSEPLKKLSVEVTADGEALNWIVEQTDDKTGATIVPAKGGELSNEAEYVVTLVMTDGAGNEGEATVTFTTVAKE